jgi:hypothetical protein
MSINATQQFDPTEHYLASREVSRGTWGHFIIWGFGALSVLLLVWHIASAWGERPPFTVLVGALPYFVLAGFWFIFIPFSQRRAARKLPETDASIRGLHTRTVDDEGFHFRGNDVALDVPWHAMQRAKETDKFFLFFYNKQCAYYLPKRALTSTEIGEVRALVREGLGDRAQGLAG